MCINYFCIILSYKYLKIFFTKISNSKILPVFLFQVDRPTARSTGACVRTCTFVHVCRSTGPVDRLKAGHSRFVWVDRTVDRQKETVFPQRGRSTGRSSGAQRLFASKATVDRPGRPPSLLLANGSFLFGQVWKSIFSVFFNRVLESCWRPFAGQIRWKEKSFNLFSPYK